MKITEGWLLERLAASPEPLRTRLSEVVQDLNEDTDLARRLMKAACEFLESVYGRLEDREAAFDLLVADGLLTLACEAVAASDPDHVVERCRSMGPGGELGELAARWAGRS